MKYKNLTTNLIKTGETGERQVNLHMKVSQNILLKSVISVVETITSDSPAQPQTVPVIIVERKGIFKQFGSPQRQCKMMNHQDQEKITRFLVQSIMLREVKNGPLKFV